MLAMRSGTTMTPVSSRTSRTTAAAGCSPGSATPLISAQCPLSTRFPSNTAPGSLTTTALTLGSQSSPVPTCLRNWAMYSGTGMRRPYRVVPQVHRVGVARPGERHVPAAGSRKVHSGRSRPAGYLPGNELGTAVPARADPQRVPGGHRYPGHPEDLVGRAGAGRRHFQRVPEEHAEDVSPGTHDVRGARRGRVAEAGTR